MNFFSGIRYNVKGLLMGLRTPRLFLLGLARFGVMVLLTLAMAWLVLAWHDEVLSLLWHRPASPWLVWLWYGVSWLVFLVLLGISGVLAYLLGQVLFSVLIMDLMSRITERMVTGQEEAASGLSILSQMVFLIRQEIPRNIIPVILTMVIMVLGWFTPLGPVLTLMGPLVAVTFMAWDNTDLVPARNFESFGDRFRFLGKTVFFHLGFGLPFLIPLLNIFFLSFAPVGATLYHIDRHSRETAASLQKTV
ncbi:EI24 domain-containing protein [Desulfosarcina sp. OttesenSCG-928-A07]|nr:EI24 domain-containing protein [Desulfosarcina sp. OttesenSCG-928-A07]